MSTTLSLKRIPNHINGRCVHADIAAHGSVYNPSTGEISAEVPISDCATLDTAVAAAKAAFPAWSETAVGARAKVLFRYRELLHAHAEPLSELICRENGKTFAEAQGDVARGIEVVEFACNIPHLLKGESLAELAPHLNGLSHRHPLGVCAGIAPFNFPAMVPMWMYPVAIACGNTFILKPSEKVPRCAIRLAELFAEAGLPPGVLNVVHGGREIVDAMCTHPDIAAVSFVGSSRVAQHVYTLASATGKRVQAAGGAKNVMVVMPDADRASTLRAIVGAAYGCAGQRCMAGSILMGIGDNVTGLLEELGDATDQLRLGDTSCDRDVSMGPLIDGAAKRRVIDSITAAEADGLTLLRDGRMGVPKQGFFVGPTLIDGVTPSNRLFRDEIFGPVLSVARPKSLDEAIRWCNTLPFGNGATIFTQSGAAARQFANGVSCGMIGVNVGVPAPIAVFPFSGWNGSFYGDLHVQGTEGISFYTRQKVVLSRWDDGYVRTRGW